MNREVFEELKQDEAFVEKVANRIYIGSDDFEDSMPEPEWICEMTDIADKYIQRFKLAFKLANKVSNQPTLNENQMIVLDYLKRQAPTGKPLQVIFWLMNTVAWDKLDELRNPIMHLTNKEQAQVLQAFATWVEQEEE